MPPAPGNYKIKNAKTENYITDSDAEINAIVKAGATGAVFSVQPGTTSGTLTIASKDKNLTIGFESNDSSHRPLKFIGTDFDWSFASAGTGRWNIRVPAQNAFWYHDKKADHHVLLKGDSTGAESTWFLEAA